MKDLFSSANCPEIIRCLDKTPYACSSATQLSGGLANLSYRGELVLPLQDGSSSVMIKYCDEKCATKDFDVPLSTSRCVMEYTMLRALQESPFRKFRHGLATIRCPQAYYLQDNTQILQYLPHEGTVHDWLLGLDKAPGDDRATQAMGAALGTWLSRFHAWSIFRCASDKRFADVVQRNTESLGHDLNTFVCDLIGPKCKNKKTMEYVARLLNPTADLQNCVTHSDFSTRNALYLGALPSVSSITGSPQRQLSVVDWETCWFGDYVRDFATMVSDLYMKYHCTGNSQVLAMLESFIAHYPLADLDAAYRAVAWVGLQMFSWFFYVPPQSKDSTKEEFVGFGMELIRMGMEKDHQAICKTFFKCLIV